MPHFDTVAVVSDVDEKEYVGLQAVFGHRVSLKVKWSYNGEIIPTENGSFKDIDRLNNDQDYAEKQLMANNQRM